MLINCHEAKHWSTAFVDDRLRSDNRSRVIEHLSACDACNTHYEQLRLIQKALGELRPATIPEQLKTNLQIIASKERAATARTRGSRLTAIWEQWKFRLNDMMRPLALPATGGLLSSLILFGTFIFTIGTTTRIASYEIPLSSVYGSEPNLVPVELRQNFVILNMSFDGNGRITDYAVSDPSLKFVAGLRGQPTTIKVPEFPTVFEMTHPVTGDIRISFEPIAFRQ